MKVAKSCFHCLINIRLFAQTSCAKCDAEAQNPSLVVFGFFIESYSTLHLLQNTFSE